MKLEELKLLVPPVVGLPQAPYREEGEHERSLLTLKEAPAQVGKLLLGLLNSLEWLVIVDKREALGQLAATEADKRHVEELSRFNSCLC